jgi:hypothetical protein
MCPTWPTFSHTHTHIYIYICVCVCVCVCMCACTCARVNSNIPHERSRILTWRAWSALQCWRGSTSASMAFLRFLRENLETLQHKLQNCISPKIKSSPPKSFVHLILMIYVTAWDVPHRRLCRTVRTVLQGVSPPNGVAERRRASYVIRCNALKVHD